MRCGTILLKPHIGTVPSPGLPTEYYPFKKMSVSRGSPCITYSGCVFVAFVTQHAKRMCHITLPSVVCLILPYFPHIISKTARFSGKNLLNKTLCFDFLYIFLFSEAVLILRILQRDIINVDRSPYKIPVILIGFLIKLKFSWRVFGKYCNIKFHENPSSRRRVVPWRTGARTDMTKLTDAFLQFCRIT